jgi:transposase
MAAKTKSMHQIRLILQHHLQGISGRGISRRLSISRNTVSHYLARFSASGLSFEALAGLDDAALAAICHPPKENPDPDGRMAVFDRLLPGWLEELKNPKVTRQLLWEEYRDCHADGYGYTQFCEYLKRHQAQENVTATFRHRAGEQLMIDFAGSPLHYDDPGGGQPVACPVFVAVLPFSNLMFCVALPSQRQEDFLGAIAGALAYIGGVPQSILYDNARNAVKRANRYEPVFTDLCDQCALHYGTTMMAARVRMPRDKPHVEGAVRIAYQRVYARLRGERFTSLAALNARIRVLVDQLNDRAMTGKGYSRRMLFERKEAGLLATLPSASFEVKRAVYATVQRNYHIQLGEDKHYYSVPYQLVGKRVMVVYTTTTVEIFLGNQQQRIAFHPRNRHSHSYTTTKAHMPANHQAISTQKGWTKEYFLAWAARIGSHCQQAIHSVLSTTIFVEQRYKSCLGILRLADHYGDQRLEAACQMTVALRASNYQRIKRILEQELDIQASDGQPEFQTPQHDNIRGPDYYQPSMLPLPVNQLPHTKPTP